MAALDPVNAEADRSPGFVWRLQADGGNATTIQACEWDVAESAGILVNMSVWTDMAALGAYVYGPLHRAILRQRRSWFALMKEAETACWWVPAGVRPTTDDAEQRIRQLRALGPTLEAFTLRTHFPPPSVARQQAVQSPDDWLCPA